MICEKRWKKKYTRMRHIKSKNLNTFWPCDEYVQLVTYHLIDDVVKRNVVSDFIKYVPYLKVTIIK